MLLLSYVEDIFHIENTWRTVSCALIITLAQLFHRPKQVFKLHEQKAGDEVFLITIKR